MWEKFGVGVMNTIWVWPYMNDWTVVTKRPLNKQFGLLLRAALDTVNSQLTKIGLQSCNVTDVLRILLDMLFEYTIKGRNNEDQIKEKSQRNTT